VVFESTSDVPGGAAGGGEIRILGLAARVGVMDVKRLEDLASKISAPAPAVHLDFVLLGAPFRRADGVYDLRGLRLALLLELLRAPASSLVAAPALHVRIKHFQGSAAGIDLVVMSEIGKAFEDAEQVLVPAAMPDLDVAGATLRTERPKPRQLVAAFDWFPRTAPAARRGTDRERDEKCESGFLHG
jgi:hypothetical protein